MLNVNVTACLLGIQAVAPNMTHNGSGRIVNVSYGLFKRLARHKEIASVIAFLRSKEAIYVCGAVWDVSGGGCV